MDCTFFFCQMLFIQGYFNVNLIHFTVKYEIYFLNIFIITSDTLEKILMQMTFK